jgi:hypothetical protein
MEQMWKTLRGDEWWYSDQFVEAGGSLDIRASPPVFYFGLKVANPDLFAANLLLYYVRRTQAEFGEYQVWCCLDPVVEPLLKELADRGQLQWQPITFPAERYAQILEVAPDNGL